MTRFKHELGFNYDDEYLASLSTDELAEMIRDSGEYDWQLIRDLVYRAYVKSDDFDDQANAFDDTDTDDAWDIALQAAEILGVVIE